jgi:hypothetical protein
MGTRNYKGLALGLVCGLGLATSVAARVKQGLPQDNRSSRADYQIFARVEPSERTLEGKETLTWLNRSNDTVDDAWFHLHHNAFSNTHSTHLWEAGGRLRGHSISSGWGWQEVTSIRVGEHELVDTIVFRAPDDGREEDRTVFSVKLPETVPRGGRLVMEIEWKAQLPRLRRRTGVSGDGNFLLMAHWFPKLGVYEGGRGWNCHQFHASTEFYGDFGSYDVTLDLPEEYAGHIGASGVQSGDAAIAGGRVTTRFLAPSKGDRSYRDPFASGATPQPRVHGFAWTADPDNIIKEHTFQFREWKELFPEEVRLVEDAVGMAPGTLTLRDVRVVALMQPEHEGQADRHIKATEAALFFYGIWFGEYPYEQVTVVDPAFSGSAAGGMEYPTLFTSGTSLFTEEASYRPESVTVHECGHQFWYGLVGNNEYEAAWLDEGFNSYADSEVLTRVYGPQRSATRYSGWPVWGKRVASEPAATGLAGFLTGQHINLGSKLRTVSPLSPTPFLSFWRDQPMLTLAENQTDPRWSDRNGYLSAADVDPVATNAWEYRDRSSYRTNSYPRPAVVLRSLQAIVGERAFLAGMRHYSAQWRYRHPYPEDFYAAFNEGAGEDVGWYFADLFEGTATVDWGVNVEQRRTPALRGMVQAADGFANVEDSEGGEPELEPDADPDSEPKAEPDSEPTAELDSEPTAELDSEPTAELDSEPTAEPGPEPAAEPAPSGEESDESKRDWIYDVIISRKGTLRLPLEIEVKFTGGAIESFEWTREAQEGATWWRLPLEPGSQRIERVLIDPARRYFLDGNMADNQWYMGKDLVAPLRWSERAFTQYAHLLHWYSSLGG